MHCGGAERNKYLRPSQCAVYWKLHAADTNSTRIVCWSRFVTRSVHKMHNVCVLNTCVLFTPTLLDGCGLLRNGVRRMFTRIGKSQLLVLTCHTDVHHRNVAEVPTK
jgi:hypothetical protein